MENTIFRMVKEDGRYKIAHYTTQKKGNITREDAFGSTDPKKCINAFVEWRYEVALLEEDMISTLVEMMAHCEDIEGRIAIGEQLKEVLYYDNLELEDVLDDPFNDVH